MRTARVIADIGGTVVAGDQLPADRLAEPPRSYDRWRKGRTVLDLIGGPCPGRCGGAAGGDHVHASNPAGTHVSTVTLDDLAGWELVWRVVWDGAVDGER